MIPLFAAAVADEDDERRAVSGGVAVVDMVGFDIFDVAAAFGATEARVAPTGRGRAWRPK